MASRAKAKEEARQRRLAQEQERAAQVQRQRRMQMLAGVVVTAIVVVGVAIAISSGGSNGTSGLQKGKQQTQTVAAVSSLLNGIPQSGTTLGNPKAPVTMTYWGDLECPICKSFTLGSFPQLVSNEVKQGKVKIVYRSFCTATCNNAGQAVFNTQQAAAYAAGLQNRFWDYAELFYHEQGSETTSYVNETYLDGLARQVPGLNFNAWKSGRQNPSVVSQVSADQQAAASQGLNGTPTVILTGPTGKKVQPSEDSASQVFSYSSLQSAIKQVS